jgi:hypothetical protein
MKLGVKVKEVDSPPNSVEVEEYGGRNKKEEVLCICRWPTA